MPAQRAVIYRLPKLFLVCPMPKTSSGKSIINAPSVVLPHQVSPFDFGKALCDVLKESSQDVGLPIDWTSIQSSRLAAAKVKTEFSFMRKSQVAFASFDGTTLALTPYRKALPGEAKHAVYVDEARVAQLSDITADHVGQACLRLFELSIHRSRPAPLSLNAV